jgi:hypothetical protein
MKINIILLSWTLLFGITFGQYNDDDAEINLFSTQLRATLQIAERVMIKKLDAQNLALTVMKTAYSKFLAAHERIQTVIKKVHPDSDFAKDITEISQIAEASGKASKSMISACELSIETFEQFIEKYRIGVKSPTENAQPLFDLYNEILKQETHYQALWHTTYKANSAFLEALPSFIAKLNQSINSTIEI